MHPTYATDRDRSAPRSFRRRRRRLGRLALAGAVSALSIGGVAGQAVASPGHVTKYDFQTLKQSA